MKIIINELVFPRERVLIQWNAWKLFASKLIEKIPDPHNAKKHYQLFIRNKGTKSVKESKTITYQSKNFENVNIAYTKSVIRKHSQTSHN